MEARASRLVSAASIHAKTSGGSCGGGEIALSGTSLAISADVDARGGAFASDEAITLTAALGDVVISGGANLWADGVGQSDGFGADGGRIAIQANDGQVLLQGGAVSAKGNAPNGAGGGVSVVGGGDVEIGAQLNTNASGGGEAGDISIESEGTVVVSALVSSRGGTALSARGGLIGVRAGGRATISGDIDASGTFAGAVEVSAASVSLSSVVSVRGRRGDGGRLEVRACQVAVAGTLSTEASNGGSAGSIGLIGASVSIEGSASISARPCADDACITIRTPSGSAAVDPAATVVPTATLVEDPLAPSC